MKKVACLALLVVSYFSPLVPSASAHMIGQPPYFKVNGVFTDYYPVPSTSLADFELPQDLVKEPILINQTAVFEIDPNALPVAKEVVEKTKFNWDFGDGSQAQGLKNSHAYAKPGTYFLNIYADSGEGFGPQLLQSTAINIVPDKNYRLPNSRILVNGKSVNDPLLDVLDVNFSEYINFDGSKSEAGSSQITSYIWDLGDQTSQNQVTFKYRYTQNPYTVFPVLRVKTKDGFISDSFVQIKDEKAFTESDVKPLIPLPEGLRSNSGSSWLLVSAAITALFLALGLIFIVIRFFSRK